MDYSKLDYALQTYKIDEYSDSWGPSLGQIIPKIDPGSLLVNPRFKSLEPVSSLHLLDFLDIYEEGDHWILTIIDVIINDVSHLIFLPLTASIPPNTPNNELSKPAFCVATESERFRKREWGVFDAFADPGFFRKLGHLFLPWTNIPENHTNAHVEIKESGVGKFNFVSKQLFPDYFPYSINLDYEFLQSSMVIKGAAHAFEIKQTLSPEFDDSTIATYESVNGWIAYTGTNKRRFIIGSIFII